MAENEERSVIEVARPNLANMTQAIVKLDIRGHFVLKQYMVQLIQSIGQYVERQIGQLAAQQNTRPIGALPSNTEGNLIEQLDLGEARPTLITLQLADRSLAVPEGIIEDVLVRVEKFIFPADFVILDYMANEKVLLILGQPFLAAGGTLIDVREGKLKMRVHDEEITFNVYKALILPKHYEDLCMISVVESKLIEESPYVEPSSMEKKIKLEKVVL
ncbi:PREDICTED: uncharacterized protein LOC109239238 [Nicotiana attenuata]|uniref:uncharacterized protein LOC109239238 n=1 Tax=Nicotiana attenuata TaxID=49451 RepID=UPI0009048F33|nr:PREDICTED: uncharacterized protein LOC109239238 [Nicotiana attenuata]